MPNRSAIEWNVQEARSPEQLELAFALRRKVFVEGQGISLEDEYDQYERDSRHYFVERGGEAIACGRWRTCDGLAKIERMAVLEGHRGHGLGAAVLEAMLGDIRLAGIEIAMCHAQIPAISLYQRRGFEPMGQVFDECGIDHQRMELRLAD